jgi:hypothetical protein
MMRHLLGVRLKTFRDLEATVSDAGRPRADHLRQVPGTAAEPRAGPTQGNALKPVQHAVGGMDRSTASCTNQAR